MKNSAVLTFKLLQRAQRILRSTQNCLIVSSSGSPSWHQFWRKRSAGLHSISIDTRKICSTAPNKDCKESNGRATVPSIMYVSPPILLLSDPYPNSLSPIVSYHYRQASKTVDFASVTRDCTQSDVCRLFLASLSLANSGNIHIKEETEAESYIFELVSTSVERPMEIYRAPSLVEQP